MRTKMKEYKMSKFIILLSVLIGTLASCVKDSEYDTPAINCKELAETIVATKTLEQVKAMYTASMVKFDTEIIIEGYVVSSDESGNIYKSLSIQDKPENPTASIKIIINEVDMYLKYNVGRKILVKLKGLALNKKDGVFEVGFPIDDTFTSIPSSILKDHVFRTCEVKTIIPKVITIAELSNNFDMLVQLDNMQFRRADIDKNLAYAQNTSSANRIIENYDTDCFKASEAIMRNSGFATFNNIPLPSGKGSIVGIPGKYLNDIHLYIRDTKDVKFDKPFCVEPATYTLLDENFEKYALDNGYTASGAYPLLLNGWTNHSTVSTIDWKLDKLSTNSFAMFQGTSTAGATQGWLISPQLEMDLQIKETFTFNIQKLTIAGNQTELEVLYSTNWNGITASINTATWTKFAITYPASTSTNVLQTFDISQITGKMYIAFRYTGNSTDRTKWRVDDIKVMGRK
jgi:hypothetical protein